MALHQAQRASAREVRQARRNFQISLWVNIQKWVSKAGESIETLLVANQKQEACKCILIWYRQVLGGKEPPLRDHLDCIATERADLYRCRQPEELRVPIMVTPSEVEDGVPEESDITQVVRGLKEGRAGGPSGMQVEDVKGWLREASREKNPTRRRYRLLVRLI